MEVSIRESTNSDSVQIADIQIKSWQFSYKGIISDNYLYKGLLLDVKSRLTNNNKSQYIRKTFLAETGNELLGFVTVGQSRDTSYSDYCEVYAIYLDPGYIHKGIGKKLFKKAFEYAVDGGYTRLFVKALEMNKLGRCFYERMNGKIIKDKAPIIIDGISYEQVVYQWNDFTKILE